MYRRKRTHLYTPRYMEAGGRRQEHIPRSVLLLKLVVTKRAEFIDALALLLDFLDERVNRIVKDAVLSADLDSGRASFAAIAIERGQVNTTR